jgi:drug/metabolite transporter (DMT)-like permease
VLIALVLVSACLHATWNALLRAEADKDRSMVIALVLATGFAVIVTAARWGLWEAPFASTHGLGFAVMAGVFEASYFATLAAALQRGRLGVVYTISRGGAVLVVWPLSVLLFAEAVTLASTLGSGLVLVGLALSGLARASGAPGRARGAVGWAVLCALSIAGYHLGYKAALREGVAPSACFALALGVAAGLNIARQGRTSRLALRAVFRARWPRLAIIGLICGGSFLMLLEALAIGGSGFVLTLRNTSVLFAAAIAPLIGERPTWRELGGAGMVAAGAAIMAM